MNKLLNKQLQAAVQTLGDKHTTPILYRSRGPELILGLTRLQHTTLEEAFTDKTTSPMIKPFLTYNGVTKDALVFTGSERIVYEPFQRILQQRGYTIIPITRRYGMRAQAVLTDVQRALGRYGRVSSHYAPDGIIDVLFGLPDQPSWLVGSFDEYFDETIAVARRNGPGLKKIPDRAYQSFKTVFPTTTTPTHLHTKLPMNAFIC